MNPVCPNYIAPRYHIYVDKNGVEREFEGTAMCELVDKPCLVEYGKPEDCEEYQQFLNELAQEDKAAAEQNAGAVTEEETK